MKPERLTLAHVIMAVAVWMVISTSLVALVVIKAGHPVGRAVILMGLGLVVIWNIFGGLLMRRFRDPIRVFVRALPGRWQVKFVLFATLLALIEEAVTTTMTNMAPVFGVPIGKAYITASANYLDVVCFHSVIIFIPMFIGWSVLLWRYDFHPNAVLLLFGLTGTIAEAGYGGPQHLLEFGMWIFVYGLMVYLPAYCVPPERGARRPPWWLYPLAVFIPYPFILLLYPFAILFHYHHPAQHYPPINANS